MGPDPCHTHGIWHSWLTVAANNYVPSCCSVSQNTILRRKNSGIPEKDDTMWLCDQDSALLCTAGLRLMKECVSSRDASAKPNGEHGNPQCSQRVEDSCFSCLTEKPWVVFIRIVSLSRGWKWFTHYYEGRVFATGTSLPVSTGRLLKGAVCSVEDDNDGGACFGQLSLKLKCYFPGDW